MLNSMHGTMREEMGKNEDVVARLQTSKVMNNRANLRNTPRYHVSAFWVVFWFVLALLAIFLWLLRLLGVVQTPW